VDRKADSVVSLFRLSHVTKVKIKEETKNASAQCPVRIWTRIPRRHPQETKSYYRLAANSVYRTVQHKTKRIGLPTWCTHRQLLKLR